VEEIGALRGMTHRRVAFAGHLARASGSLAVDEGLDVGSAEIDPLDHAGDRLVGQSRCPVRHGRLLAMRDQLDQQTLVGVERHDRLAAGAALHQPFPRGQIELAASLFSAMTAQAMVSQQGPDVFFEQLQPPVHTLGMVRGQARWIFRRLGRRVVPPRDCHDRRGPQKPIPKSLDSHPTCAP
jgi:hypothetical protein